MKLAIITGLLVTGAALSVSGCEPMARISDGSLRNATAAGAAGELRRLGHQPKGVLRCETPASNTRSVVRIDCRGRTAAGEPIEVTGAAHDADTPHPQESYVIKVGGREVLRTNCLDSGCRH